MLQSSITHLPEQNSSGNYNMCKLLEGGSFWSHGTETTAKDLNTQEKLLAQGMVRAHSK